MTKSWALILHCMTIFPLLVLLHTLSYLSSILPFEVLRDRLWYWDMRPISINNLLVYFQFLLISDFLNHSMFPPQNPVAEIQKLNEFMGTGRSSELVEAIADATSFSNMKPAKRESELDVKKHFGFIANDQRTEVWCTHAYIRLYSSSQRDIHVCVHNVYSYPQRDVHD